MILGVQRVKLMGSSLDKYYVSVYDDLMYDYQRPYRICEKAEKFQTEKLKCNLTYSRKAPKCGT